jgi:hypothetical protein
VLPSNSARSFLVCRVGHIFDENTIQLLLQRKDKRKWAYYLIAGAVISLAAFLLELILL